MNIKIVNTDRILPYIAELKLITLTLILVLLEADFK